MQPVIATALTSDHSIAPHMEIKEDTITMEMQFFCHLL